MTPHRQVPGFCGKFRQRSPVESPCLNRRPLRLGDPVAGIGSECQTITAGRITLDRNT